MSVTHKTLIWHDNQSLTIFRRKDYQWQPPYYCPQSSSLKQNSSEETSNWPGPVLVRLWYFLYCLVPYQYILFIYKAVVKQNSFPQHFLWSYCGCEAPACVVLTPLNVMSLNITLPLITPTSCGGSVKITPVVLRAWHHASNNLKEDIAGLKIPKYSCINRCLLNISSRAGDRVSFTNESNLKENNRQ